jgi:uncharacterized OB-fold protein
MTADSPLNTQTREGQERLKAMGVKPVPSPDDVTRPYWEAARAHELRIQRCAGCQDYQHPPKATCATCGSGDLEWTRLSGRGVIYPYIIDRRMMTPGFNEPYAVAQVVPVEAQRDTVRITTNIRGCELEDIYIDMPVEVLFEDANAEVTLPQFGPAPEAKLRSRGEERPGPLM